MITDENLPDDWKAESERSEYDDMIDRELESKRYKHRDSETSVFINEVQEPKDLEGWGYQVVVEHETGDVEEEKLGIVAELEEAREMALDYMREYGDE